MEILKLLKALMDVRSPYGEEEKLAFYILDYLKGLGYPAMLDGLNVLLNPDEKIIIATHLDTVKADYPFRLDSEYAYGTGVCDAKASIAAILSALERIEELNFGVALFYDEENEGKGSEIYCEKYRPEMAIVMEPTDLTVANVQYGGLEVKLSVKGKAVHASTPEAGINAIEKCMGLLNRISRLSDIKVSVQRISGGGGEYVIPERCEVQLELLFRPEIKAAAILNKLKDICREKAEIKVEDIYDGFVSGEAAQLLVKALEKAGCKAVFSEMPSWNDSINLHSIGCDVAVFGPGELPLCHTREERVKIKDVESAANVLVALNDLL